MSRKVILTGDSTADLGAELKTQFGVRYARFHIILDGSEYIDGVTISPDDIYNTFWEKHVLPKTAALNTEEYLSFFRPFVEAGYDVIHICLSSGITSSCGNCFRAAEELGHVYVVDSRCLSTGSGMLFLKAKQLLSLGLDAAETHRILVASVSHLHASFVVDTLEFLHAGGRCSALAKFGANLLGLKPCIQVDTETGTMGVGKKYRGKLSDVLVKYTKDQLAAYPNIAKDFVFITHSGIDRSCIDAVKATIEETMEFRNIYITRAGCAISSHCGPNTLGVLFMTENE